MNSGAGFRVSVVIPLYNKAPFIRRTLESVLAQTLPADEIIVVDDGSTDESAACVRELANASIRLITQRNGGPGPARNRGVAEATQPWVAFLDGDDLWRPHHLHLLARLSARFPEADAVATGFQRRRAGSDTTSSQSDDDHNLDGALIDYFTIMSGENTFFSSSVAIRRATLHQIGDFGAFWPGEDREYWIRLALNHQIAMSKRRTAFYVQRTGGLMDTIESGKPIGFWLHPIFVTLDRALADPRYRAKHAALRNFRANLFRESIRQSLYRGEMGVARQYISELEKRGPAPLGLLRALCWLPGRLIRAGISTRSWLRRPIISMPDSKRGR